jgi:hypothetical protein
LLLALIDQLWVEALSDASLSSQVKEILAIKLDDAKDEAAHNKRMRQLQEIKLQMELRAMFNSMTSPGGPQLQLGNQRANLGLNQSIASVEQLPSRPQSPATASGSNETAAIDAQMLQDLPWLKPLDEAIKCKNSAQSTPLATAIGTQPPAAKASNATHSSSSSSSSSVAGVQAQAQQASANDSDNDIFERYDEVVADAPTEPLPAATATATPVDAPGLVLLSEHSESAGGTNSKCTAAVLPTASTEAAAATAAATAVAAAAADGHGAKYAEVLPVLEQQVVTIQDVEVAVACTDTIDSIVDRVALNAAATSDNTTAAVFLLI